MPRIETCIQVIPNPALNQAEVIWDASEIAKGQIEVRSVAGQSLFHRAVNSGKVLLNIEDWPVGIYYVKVWNEEKQGLAKLIVLQ